MHLQICVVARTFACGILLVAAALPARAEEAALAPTQDTTILEENPTYSNGAGSNVFIGAIASGGARRALLKFDLSSIPVNATLTSARLRFVVNRAAVGSGLDDVATLHRVTAAWGEGTSSTSGGSGSQATPEDATWQYRFYGNPSAGVPRSPWSVAGGDFVFTASAAVTVGGIGNYQFQSTPQLVADVQSWVLDSTSNHGWIIVGPEGGEQTARRIDSRESASVMSRPLLTVTYTIAQDADVPLPFWSLGLLALGLFGLANRTKVRVPPADSVQAGFISH